MSRPRALLWLDASAAALAGLLVLALHGWLARLFGFPPALVLFIGAMNLAYAAGSGTLATRASRSGALPAIASARRLVAANAAWVLVCLTMATMTWRSAHGWGTAYVLAEATFVGALALAERRWLLPHGATTSAPPLPGRDA